MKEAFNPASLLDRRSITVLRLTRGDDGPDSAAAPYDRRHPPMELLLIVLIF